MNPLQISADGGVQFNVLGTALTIRVHGRDTGGTLAVVQSRDLPGQGPPPHVHHTEDETFQVLEGDYEFLVAGETVRAGVGTTLFAPRDVPHTYRCVSETPGLLMCVITPSGFEGFFEEVGAMTAEEQQDIPRVLEIAGRYGLEILPPPGV